MQNALDIIYSSPVLAALAAHPWNARDAVLRASDGSAVGKVDCVAEATMALVEAAGLAGLDRRCARKAVRAEFFRRRLGALVYFGVTMRAGLK